jgi:hypothetical protein
MDHNTRDRPHSSPASLEGLNAKDVLAQGKWSPVAKKMEEL